jgi:hypothetical protein
MDPSFITPVSSPVKAATPNAPYGGKSALSLDNISISFAQEKSLLGGKREHSLISEARKLVEENEEMRVKSCRLECIVKMEAAQRHTQDELIARLMIENAEIKNQNAELKKDNADLKKQNALLRGKNEFLHSDVNCTKLFLANRVKELNTCKADLERLKLILRFSGVDQIVNDAVNDEQEEDHEEGAMEYDNF